MGVNTIPAPAGAITAGNVSLLASGSLSGSSLTLTGLSNYQILNLQIWGPQQGPSYSSTSWYWYLNGDTSSVYQALAGGFATSDSSPTGNGSATSTNISAQGPFNVNGYNARFFELNLSNCKTLGYTTFDVFGFFQNNGSGTPGHNQSSGAYQVNNTISSITFTSASGSSMTLGTYTLYGA